MHRPLSRHKEIAKDMFDELDENDAEFSDREFIMEVVACYHYRNGKKHDDGSMGEISITPKEFRDILTYVAMEYFG